MISSEKPTSFNRLSGLSVSSEEVEFHRAELWMQLG